MEKILLNETRQQIILGLAANGMKPSQTARSLYMDRQTVVNNVEKIKQLTGKDPLNFYDLYELVLFVKGVIKHDCL